MKTPQQFYQEQNVLGYTVHITDNPNPDYSLEFYQQIFDLMKAYAKEACKEQRKLCVETFYSDYAFETAKEAILNAPEPKL